MAVGSLSQNGSACVALGRERPGGAAWVSGARQSARPLGALAAGGRWLNSRPRAPGRRALAASGDRQEIEYRARVVHGRCVFCGQKHSKHASPREPVLAQ
jgi:hypothetical protein